MTQAPSHAITVTITGEDAMGLIAALAEAITGEPAELAA
jgi:predicted amino acid-binding ACT domain protein